MADSQITLVKPHAKYKKEGKIQETQTEVQTNKFQVMEKADEWEKKNILRQTDVKYFPMLSLAGYCSIYDHYLFPVLLVWKSLLYN